MKLLEALAAIAAIIVVGWAFGIVVTWAMTKIAGMGSG